MWQCALLQRWLPEYPDGDLPAFWKRRLDNHLEHCPECRQELAALREVVAVIKAAPVAEPEPEFWSEFSRELHLKLARVANEVQESPAAAPKPWWLRLPYLLGAPALAVLALWIMTYFSNPERPALAPPPQVAQEAAPEAPKLVEAPKAERGRTPALAEIPLGATADQFCFATLGEEGACPDDDLDLSSGDLDSILAGMSDQEKETFLKRLHQKKKDGSCLESACSTYLA
jgi:anti-sigma factor RsiW